MVNDEDVISQAGEVCNEVSFSRKSFFANLSKLFPLSVGIVGSLGLILISLVSLLKARSSDFRFALSTIDFEASGHVFAL